MDREELSAPTTAVQANNNSNKDGGQEKAESASTSAAKKVSSSKSKRRRRTKRGAGGGGGFPSAPDDDDAEELKKRLLKRSSKEMQAKGSSSSRGGRKREAERGPVAKRRPPPADSSNTSGRTNGGGPVFDTSSYDIVNPSTYDKLFSRLEETHFNKATKPDGPCSDATPWICCFCQRRSCVDDLGDLFGPYYVKLSYPTFWPPFLDPPKKQEQQKQKESESSDVYADLWFHGDCVCWAPGVLLRGSGMTGLDEYLPKYWSQKCTRCHELGANIACSVKGCNHRFHFPCALQSGCNLKESNYSMHCDIHKRSTTDKKKVI